MATLDSFTGDRTLYDGLIKDIAGRFGLGTSAGPLVQEVVNMVTGSPGGVGGFVDKLRSAGLGSEITSWLGNANAAPLSAQQLTRVIGPSVLGDIGSRLGLGASAVSAAVGYILPKLIGMLTPGGAIPAYAGSEVHAPPPVAPRVVEPYIQRAPRLEQVAPRHLEVIHDEPHMTRWLWPLLGALAVLGLGSYFLSRPPAPPPTVAQAPAPAPAPAAPLQPARLTLSNEDGVIHYSGSVHDEETRNSIINSLKAVFGADKVQGDIAIDLNRAAAPWLVNLRNALDNLKVPGVQAAFDGNSVNLGGVISDADRTRISNSLRNVLGSGMVFGTLSDRLGELASDANNKAMAALSSLKPGFDAKDLTAALNQSVINFPAGGAELPATAAGLLQNAAAQIKQLPPNTMLEIAGYTDNTGDPAANVTLSQQRADAVRNELIKDGDNAGMLVAKGYGGANPVANNDLLEGRYRNRRIEYHVVNKP
ncbi:MAG: OmpA family protein [Gammaproteobacteria bacterium]|nr:OmpA family protein [Gammaproteobacteria bacterium]